MANHHYHFLIVEKNCNSKLSKKNAIRILPWNKGLLKMTKESNIFKYLKFKYSDSEQEKEI